MIHTLENTNTSQVAAALRKDFGTPSSARVLNLIAVISEGDDLDRALDICGAASREHPCRVLIVVEDCCGEKDSLRADIHVGDESGPSEVVVLYPTGKSAKELDTLVMPLLLADTPVVAYWPFDPPAAPTKHPLGSLAVRRITDSRATQDPIGTLRVLAENYVPGDTDLSWAAITLWRGLVAAVFEEYKGFELKRIKVKGNCDHPAPYLMAAWLKQSLKTDIELYDFDVDTLRSVRFVAPDDSQITVRRDYTDAVAELVRPNLPKTLVNLQLRPVEDCLMEDLRQLDADDLYGEIITSGLLEAQVLPDFREDSAKK